MAEPVWAIFDRRRRYRRIGVHVGSLDVLRAKHVLRVDSVNRRVEILDDVAGATNSMEKVFGK